MSYARCGECRGEPWPGEGELAPTLGLGQCGPPRVQWGWGTRRPALTGGGSEVVSGPVRRGRLSSVHPDP